MLINYTENSSESWSEEQKEKARKQYLEVTDIQFPEIGEEWSKEQIYDKACQELEKIIKTIEKGCLDDKTTFVLCEGERNFSFLMINLLLSKNIKVVSSVQKRDGTFYCFRPYDTRRFPKDNTKLFPAIYNHESENDKILIAQLGKGGYQTTIYVDEKGKKLSTTGYGFDAIVRKENPNKLLLTGTTESGWAEILDWYGKSETLTNEQEEKKQELLDRLKEDGKKRRENKKKKPEEREKVIEAESFIWKEIEKYIMHIANFESVKIAIIPKGQNDKELVEYFDILREALQGITKKGKETEVIFDISNGFRSMPLYIMMIVKFVSLINNESIKYTAYYGMFEAKDEKNRTPLVNLTKVTEMTEWINAISEFRNFGSVKALYQCLDMEKEGKSDKEKKEIQDIIQKFEEFDLAMNMNNLHYLKLSIEYIENLNSNCMPLPQQAKVMLESLGNDFKRRFIDVKYNLNERYEYAYMLMKLSELYMEQGRYNMAAIASQEGVITYIMEKYLKEELKKSLYLNDGEFKEYVQQHKAREQVKGYFDGYLDKNEKQEYAFGENYKNVKDKIRNIGAHILPNDKMPDLKEIEEWIYMSINSILKDMEENISLEHETEILDLNFKEIYRDFCKANTKIRETREKRLNERLFGKKGDKKWEFLDEKHEEIESKYSDICEEYELDIDKLKEFHTAITFVKEKNERGESITEEEIQQNSFLKFMLELREMEGKNKIDELLKKYQKGERITTEDAEKIPWFKEMLKISYEKGEQSRRNLLKKIEKQQGKGFMTFQNLVKDYWKKAIIDKLKKN